MSTISNKKYDVCVIGQGFVGLPLALLFAVKNLNVVGVDIDEFLVENLNKGLTKSLEKHKSEHISDILKKQIYSKKYIATNDIENAIKNSANIIITVGIPINNGVPNKKTLLECCKIVGKNIRKNQLVIIRSTVIPGMTEEDIIPLIEKESRMKNEKDFYIAYSSERISEGNAFDEFENMPTLIGAKSKYTLEKAKKIISKICKSDIMLSYDITAVETSKVFENVQRDVNIALAQEFARYTESIGTDIFEVVKLANTHSRVNLLYPGAGVGGYCIPNAYYYMSPRTVKKNLELKICRTSRNINENIPNLVVNKVKELLEKNNKEIKKSKICILGLAMKDYSNDIRLSPALEISYKLKELGIKVEAFDPIVNNEEIDFLVSNQYEAIKDSDAILVLVKQHYTEYDNLQMIKKIMKSNPIYMDMKNVVKREDAYKYGFEYWKV